MIPKTSDVGIIGGGVMGASTAYHLALKGCQDVLLLERESFFGTQATGRCAGAGPRGPRRAPLLADAPLAAADPPADPAGAQRRVARQPRRLQRPVQPVAGDLPEIRMPAGDRAQPGVLQLLQPPCPGDGRPVLGKGLAARLRRRLAPVPPAAPGKAELGAIALSRPVTVYRRKRGLLVRALRAHRERRAGPRAPRSAALVGAAVVERGPRGPRMTR